LKWGEVWGGRTGCILSPFVLFAPAVFVYCCLARLIQNRSKRHV